MEASQVRKLKFFAPILGFLFGVLLSSLSLAALSGAAFALFLGILIWVYARVLWKEWKEKALVTLAALFLIFASLGIVRSYFVLLPKETSLTSAESSVGIYGTISREPRARESYREYVIHTPGGTGILVRAESFPEFMYGDKVVVRGSLERPEAFETEEGRVFDYGAYLKKEGISFILSYAKTEKVGEGGSPVRRMLFGLKRSFLERLNAAVPHPESALLSGILLGTEGALSDDLLDAFRTVGIIHIIVLSGYNITIVAESVLRSSSFLGRRKALIISAVGVILFSLMVGGGPSVVRASLMGLLVLLARVTRRRYDVARALFLAAGLMVLWNPMVLVYDLGFQLSFLATVAIIWVVPLIIKRTVFLPEKFNLRDIFATTFATQIFVLPLLMYASGTISLAGFAVNLLVLPVIAVLMLTSFITGLVGFFSSSLSLVPGVVAYGMAAYIIGLSEWVASLPISAVSIPPVPFWVPLGIYAVFCVLLFRMRKSQESQKSIVQP